MTGAGMAKVKVAVSLEMEILELADCIFMG